MQRQLLILILICTFITGNSQSDIDVLHYRFHIELGDGNDSIYGAATIKYVIKEKKTAIHFDLTAVNKDGKGMIATEVGYKKYPGIETFRQDNDKLIISSNLKKGDTAEVNINYKGIPADGLIISKNKYGHRTFFADNWPNRGHNWLPCHDDPADKATVEFIITAPQHYQVVANGLQIEETNLAENKKITHWKEEVPVSTKVMVIGVADFAVNLSGYVNDCIPVYSWVYPEDRDKGFYDFALAKEILPFFIKTIGPYGYKKLANVQSKTRFSGLENANTIFYSEQSVTGNRSEEALYAHEIAHQWFGNMATEKNFGHLWLSEGFATFFETYYLEEKYGKERGLAIRKEDRDIVIQYLKNNFKVIVDTTETDFMKLLNPNNYQKGGWILHMLRSQLGDSIFWKAIRKYYSTYAGGIADTKDLQKVVESVSGEKLDKFFSQWLYNTVNPSLKLTWKYSQKEKKVQVTLVQTQGGVPFHFPLDVEITFTDGNKITKRLVVDNQSKKVDWPVTGKPSGIRLDPNVSLLFEGTVNELK